MAKARWITKEEEALRAGVAKYGPGKWKMILVDPTFRAVLGGRTNVDLKDKWRNMINSAGQAQPRERVKAQKPKAHAHVLLPDLNVSSLPAAQNRSMGMVMDHSRSSDLNISPVPTAPKESMGTVMGHSKSPDYRKTDTQRHNVMTCETPSTMKDPNGPVTNSVMDFNEVENFCKIIKDGMPGQNTPVDKQKENHQKELLADIESIGVEVRKAAQNAAQLVAVAENTAYKANEASELVDNSAKMEEESDSLLVFLEDIFERCMRGEVVQMK